MQQPIANQPKAKAAIAPGPALRVDAGGNKLWNIHGGDRG
jgi:hypothetical protein